MLDIEELNQLLDEIRIRVIKANRLGQLDELLKSLKMHDLIETSLLPGRKDGKIVVIGASDVDENHLLITAGKIGIDKKRFEFCLNYDEIQKYNFRKLQYTDKYRVVIVGPMPHSSKGKADSSSAIAEMEKHSDLFPRIVRLGNGNELKISISNFREALLSLKNEDYI